MRKSASRDTATGAPAVSASPAASPVSSSPVSSPSSSPDLSEWHMNLSDIESLAQSGFGQIRSLVRLSVLALEQPTATAPEDLAAVLQVIWRICEDRADGIHSLAQPLLAGGAA